MKRAPWYPEPGEGEDSETITATETGEEDSVEAAAVADATGK